MTVFNSYRFDFCVVCQAVLSELSAVTGGLVTSERSLNPEHVITVNPAEE